MTAKLHNDLATSVFHNGLPRSLFESSDAAGIEAKADFSAFRDPLVEVACEIESLFVDEVDGESYQQREPTLEEVVPLARRLIALTTTATGATANVRQSLLEWLDAPKQVGRAWNIKTAAQQLSEMVLEQPSLDTAASDDGLPF